MCIHHHQSHLAIHTIIGVDCGKNTYPFKKENSVATPISRPSPLRPVRARIMKRGDEIVERGSAGRHGPCRMVGAAGSRILVPLASLSLNTACEKRKIDALHCSPVINFGNDIAKLGARGQIYVSVKFIRHQT